MTRPAASPEPDLLSLAAAVEVVDDGIGELRIDHGPGYRLYYSIRENVIVFMLVGGIKRSQDRDISRAKQLAKDI